MNLARHAAVLWRHRAVALTGGFLAVVLAILASYQVVWAGGPSFKKRGVETWTATSTILVTQPGFPEGRVTLPTAQVGNAKTTDGTPATAKLGSTPSDQVEFADPGRFGALADLYSRFLMGDEVRSAISSRPKPDQIIASPFQASSGGTLLPIIQLATSATTETGANRLNLDTFAALRALLNRDQRQNHIALGHRVEVRYLTKPDKAQLTSGHKPVGAILVFLLVGLGTVALCHLLTGLRGKGAAGGTASETQLAIVDWDVPQGPIVAQERAADDAGSRQPEPLAPARSQASAGAGTGDGPWAGWPRA